MDTKLRRDSEQRAIIARRLLEENRFYEALQLGHIPTNLLIHNAYYYGVSSHGGSYARWDAVLEHFHVIRSHKKSPVYRPPYSSKTLASHFVPTYLVPEKLEGEEKKSS